MLHLRLSRLGCTVIYCLLSLSKEPSAVDTTAFQIQRISSYKETKQTNLPSTEVSHVTSTEPIHLPNSSSNELFTKQSLSPSEPLTTFTNRDPACRDQPHPPNKIKPPTKPKPPPRSKDTESHTTPANQCPPTQKPKPPPRSKDTESHMTPANQCPPTQKPKPPPRSKDTPGNLHSVQSHMAYTNISQPSPDPPLYSTESRTKPANQSPPTEKPKPHPRLNKPSSNLPARFKETSGNQPPSPMRPHPCSEEPSPKQQTEPPTTCANPPPIYPQGTKPEGTSTS